MAGNAANPVANYSRGLSSQGLSSQGLSSQGSPAVSLNLQSLIDARHDIVRGQSTANTGRSDFPGQRTGIRRGHGLEFIDLRQYNPSDDVRHIDWNVTARSNEPYTRLYREEREHITTVVVDLRPLMFTGSNKLRSVSASLNAALILWQANESGDRCASIVISAAGIQQSRPVAGSKGVLRALELIQQGFDSTQKLITDNSHQTRPAIAVLSDALMLINSARGRSGSYFFLSGFDTEDDKHWSNTLPVTAMTGRMKAILLLDKLELEGLPEGSYQYRTRRKKVTARITSDNRKALIDELRLSILQRQVQFADTGIPLLSVSTETAGADFMAQVINQELL